MMSGRRAWAEIRQTYRFIRPYLLRHKLAYAGLLLLLFTDIGLTIGFAWLYGSLLDAAVHGSLSDLMRLLPEAVGMLIVSAVSTYSSLMLETVTVNGTKRELRAHLYRHLLLLPMGRFKRLGTGDLLAHFSHDIHGVDGLIGANLLEVLRLPIFYAAVLGYMLHLHWQLAVLSLIMAPFAAVGGAFLGRKLRSNGRQYQALAGSMTSHLQESWLGYDVIRAFALEKAKSRRFASQADELYRLEQQNARLSGIFRSGEIAAGFLVYLVSLGFGAAYISEGVMSVGALLTFLNLVHRLVFPLSGLAGQWSGFQRSLAAVERISGVLALPAESERLPVPLLPPRLKRGVSLRNIRFGYDEYRLIFDRFTLDLPAGSVTAIVGRSGAGKTTLLQLLQGMLQASGGEVQIDGVSISAMPKSELRSYYAYVPQETFLFEGTIRENLKLARPGVDDAFVAEAAKAANLHEFVMSLPSGYDTPVGERGARLSSGQKQRIAIARALLKDAPILLLDEATSALDSENEQLITEALARLMRGRTTVIVAHRLSTIRHADRILVLEQGEVVQSGTHDALVNQPGLYRELYSMKEPASDDIALAAGRL